MGQDLDKLRESANNKLGELRKLQSKIQDLEAREELPILKKKFEGKYFKYRNSHGPNSGWWMYSHCKKVNSVYTFVYDTFQSYDNKNEFEINDKAGSHLCQIQISKAEYTRELKKLINRVSKL